MGEIHLVGTCIDAAKNHYLVSSMPSRTHIQVQRQRQAQRPIQVQAPFHQMFKKKAGAEGTNEGTHAPTAALLGESQHVALGAPYHQHLQDFQD